jgi:DNA-binding IclR family transcriptional regulator
VSTVGLTPVAAYVMRSLRDHPGLSTPEAIAAGPEAPAGLSPSDVREALADLQRRGLVGEGPGGWRLADAARGG